MPRNLLLCVAVLCALLIAPASRAATLDPATGESWSKDVVTAQLAQLTPLLGTVRQPQVKQYLEGVRTTATALLTAPAVTPGDGVAVQHAVINAAKLAKDLQAKDAAGLWMNSPFVVYTVPALSPLKRLPNTLPEDGALSDQLSVISAQGEYEAASFVLAPMTAVKALTFTVSNLQGPNGTIPASAVDLRLVKCWYQSGTAWYSYFADPTRYVLVPELLLHDETLIRVDDARQGNDLRVDYPQGSKYIDISSRPGTGFNYYTEPVEDSPTMQPITLQPGAAKQMWVTTRVPKGTPGGFYTGRITMTADGQPAGTLTLTIRVLPFELPSPKTYYDLNKDFYAMLYHHCNLQGALEGTKGDTKLAETRLLNEYRNLAEHNVVNFMGPTYEPGKEATFIRQLELMKQGGLSTKPLFCVYNAWPPYGWLTKYKTPEFRPVFEQTKREFDAAYDFVTKTAGHNDIYFEAWDEAGWDMLQFQQEAWKYLQDKGIKVYATGTPRHLKLDVKEDFLDISGLPSRDLANQWHALGNNKLITNYAGPHTGPENPDLIRQRHGMWLYKANFDATFNYIFYEGHNIWNDHTNGTFRDFNLVYPTKTSLIDTIAWEGFREGLDDIRYATKLKQLAADALASGQPARVTAAQNALTWLEVTDERTVNADLLRIGMVSRILDLLALQNAQ